MDRIYNPPDQSVISHRQNLHKMFLGSVMYGQESGIMSGSPVSFGFLPSVIPHTMHLSYPSITAMFSQTKHISNKLSLTLCIVTIHPLFLTPSISFLPPTCHSSGPTQLSLTPTHPQQQSSFIPSTLQSHFILYANPTFLTSGILYPVTIISPSIPPPTYALSMSHA